MNFSDHAQIWPLPIFNSSLIQKYAPAFLDLVVFIDCYGSYLFFLLLQLSVLP